MNRCRMLFVQTSTVPPTTIRYKLIEDETEMLYATQPKGHFESEDDSNIWKRVAQNARRCFCGCGESHHLLTFCFRRC